MKIKYCIHEACKSWKSHCLLLYGNFFQVFWMTDDIYQWENFKTHGNILKVYLFGQTTYQQLRTFEPQKSQKYKQLWGMRLETSCLW